MLQNATRLRKSAPGPPNSSDEHVSCTTPATENASLQILFKCPTPAIVFGNSAKPARFAHFDKVRNPVRLPRETTSERPKVVRACGVFQVLTSKCASRHNGVHFFDKVVRSWSALYILTLKCASRHNGVQFFISYLASWLRTRCFSEPPQIIGKTQCFATFLPFRAPGSSFFWDFLFSDLLSSSLLFSDSSHLCFSSVHIVGSLTSKLPSNINNIQ